MRDRRQGLALARTIQRAGSVALHGIEGYEGLFPAETAERDVPAYLDEVVGLLAEARRERLFADPDQIVLTAGGSAFFDLVADRFSGRLPPGVFPVARSGAYIVHDAGFYERHLANIVGRGGAIAAPALRPALEVRSRILSRPEPGLAILSAGKRDVSHDVDLPRPWLHYRSGEPAPRRLTGWSITKLSDQHAFLQIPPDADVAIGDRVALAISHPCTTFDKWQLLLEIDDAYQVVGAIRTSF